MIIVSRGKVSIVNGGYITDHTIVDVIEQTGLLENSRD